MKLAKTGPQGLHADPGCKAFQAIYTRHDIISTACFATSSGRGADHSTSAACSPKSIQVTAIVQAPATTRSRNHNPRRLLPQLYLERIPNPTTHDPPKTDTLSRRQARSTIGAVLPAARPEYWDWLHAAAACWPGGSAAPTSTCHRASRQQSAVGV